MKRNNRPLSPHLTIFTPQLTSTLSILHRVSGAFLASLVLLSLLCLKIGDLSLCLYPVYWCVFVGSAHGRVFFSLTHLALLALCYHMSNGLRHVFWDLGFCLELSKVYTSGIIMLFSAILVAVWQWRIIDVV